MERVETEHKRVEGILFEACGPWGTVTVIGIPFEHANRLWAIHQKINSRSLWPQWVVSDVETGRAVPRVAEDDPETARMAAIAVIDAAGGSKINAAVRAARSGGNGIPTKRHVADQSSHRR